jgi:hypothetical protein
MCIMYLKREDTRSVDAPVALEACVCNVPQFEFLLTYKLFHLNSVGRIHHLQPFFVFRV